MKLSFIMRIFHKFYFYLLDHFPGVDDADDGLNNCQYVRDVAYAAADGPPASPPYSQIFNFRGGERERERAREREREVEMENILNLSRICHFSQGTNFRF